MPREMILRLVYFQDYLRFRKLRLVSPDEARMIMATGSYLGESFDDAGLTRCFSQCRFRGEERSSSR